MVFCVTSNFVSCIFIDVVRTPTEFNRAMDHFFAKFRWAREECLRFCFFDQKVVSPQHAYCYVDCLETLI
jgi:hypothetical protein